MVALIHQIRDHPGQQGVGDIGQRNVLPQFSFRPCTVYDLADQKIHRPVFLLFRYPLPQKISLLGMIRQQMQKRHDGIHTLGMFFHQQKHSVDLGLQIR